MEYGIIVACVSLFGTLVLVLADVTAEIEPPAAQTDTVTPEWKQAA